MRYTKRKLASFIRTVRVFYSQHKRVLPWRETTDPYCILVSEVMLQQTQVYRVITKYAQFIGRFPDFKSLSAAKTEDVLKTWQGMGYNRRALYLKRIAQTVIKEYDGRLPRNINELDMLPGIGPATAASIAVYAYNTPTVFIETNVRRVYLHHFFTKEKDIDDRQLIPLVEATLDRANPKEWYYALMDYGTYLAKTVENPNRRSRHYSVQSRFEGSNRQIRGRILRLLLSGGYSEEEICRRLKIEERRLETVLAALVHEGFIRLNKNLYTIA